MSDIERLEVCEACGKIASETVVMPDGVLRYYCLRHLPQNVRPATDDEAAEARARTETSERDQLRAALAAAEQRVEAAEAKLARVDEYGAYYAIAWEWFEADSDGPEPLTFAEWLDEQSEVQP